MKKYYAILLSILLLLSSSFVIASNKAVNISLTDSAGTLNSADTQLIYKKLSGAVSSGLVDTLLTYKPSQAASNKLLVCAEVNVATTAEQFTAWVNSLHKLKLHATARYQITPVDKCGKNDGLACMAAPLSCFSPSFINSSAYSTFVAKTQFALALEDISVGKLMMSLKINEDPSFDPSGDITLLGLPFQTANCVISATASTIVCSIKGNALLLDHFITLERDNQNNWRCLTNVDAKYATPQCKDR